MDRPACPICGAIDSGPPDPLGVHRCASCRIEFRPDRRMPIRRATVTPVPSPDLEHKGTIAAAVVIAGLLGLAFAVGKHEASKRDSAYEVPQILDPAIPESLSALDRIDSPLGPVTLARELHLSQISEGELFATGLVHGHDVHDVEEIIVLVSCRDLAGKPLASQRALVSCRSLHPKEQCAWMIQAKVPGSIAEVEFDAFARRSLGLEPPPFDLRSSRDNRLELDPERRVLKFETHERLIEGAWATITAYSESERVLGVAETRWPEPLRADSHAREVALPRSPNEVARYEIHVGGRLDLPPR